MGVTAPTHRKVWIRDLMISCETLGMLLIHMAAKLVERTLDEPTVVGGTAAIFSIGGSPWTQSRWTIRLELTQFDADTVALAKVVEVLMNFYCSDGAPTPPPLIYLHSIIVFECNIGGEKPAVYKGPLLCSVLSSRAHSFLSSVLQCVTNCDLGSV